MQLPWIRDPGEAEVEQLGGALGTLAGGDVAADVSASVPRVWVAGGRQPVELCELGMDLHVGKLAGDDETVGANHSLASDGDSLLSVGSQWDVSAASVPAIEGPFGLAVADDEDLGRVDRRHAGLVWCASAESAEWGRTVPG